MTRSVTMLTNPHQAKHVQNTYYPGNFSLGEYEGGFKAQHAFIMTTTFVGAIGLGWLVALGIEKGLQKWG